MKSEEIRNLIRETANANFTNEEYQTRLINALFDYYDMVKKSEDSRHSQHFAPGQRGVGVSLGNDYPKCDCKADSSSTTTDFELDLNGHSEKDGWKTTVRVEPDGKKIISATKGFEHFGQLYDFSGDRIEAK